MTEFAAKLEAERLAEKYGGTFSVIACDGVGCTWAMIIPGELVASKAIAICSVLGMVVIGGIDTDMITFCPSCTVSNADTERSAGLPAKEYG